jgi:hypothetical protein
MPRKKKETEKVDDEAIEVVVKKLPLEIDGIEIPPPVATDKGYAYYPELVRVRLRGTGTHGILFNRMPDISVLDSPGSGPRATPDSQTPRTIASLHLHRNGSPDPCIPAEMIMASIKGGGKFFRYSGRRMFSTARGSLLSGMVSICEPYVKLESPETWSVDSRMAINPNTGTAVVSHRPRFTRWEVEFTMLVNVALVPSSKIRSIIDMAGIAIGLGSYRLERGGPFGKFRVDQWKVLT